MGRLVPTFLVYSPLFSSVPVAGNVLPKGLRLVLPGPYLLPFLKSFCSTKPRQRFDGDPLSFLGVHFRAHDDPRVGQTPGASPTEMRTEGVVSRR